MNNFDYYVVLKLTQFYINKNKYNITISYETIEGADKPAYWLKYKNNPIAVIGHYNENPIKGWILGMCDKTTNVDFSYLKYFNDITKAIDYVMYSYF